MRSPILVSALLTLLAVASAGAQVTSAYDLASLWFLERNQGRQRLGWKGFWIAKAVGCGVGGIVFAAMAREGGGGLDCIGVPETRLEGFVVGSLIGYVLSPPSWRWWRPKSGWRWKFPLQVGGL